MTRSVSKQSVAAVGSGRNEELGPAFVAALARGR